MTTLFKFCHGIQPFRSFLQPTLDSIALPCRGLGRQNPRPKQRFPPWFIKQDRARAKEDLTKENREFIQQVISDRYPTVSAPYTSYSPLKLDTIEPAAKWNHKYQRVGLLARKLGIYPMWMKNGQKVLTTMFQVADNHVIKYTPPEEYKTENTTRKNPTQMFKKGAILVGADSADPQLFTKEYCGMFEDSGVMPKRLLARFFVSPEAALQPGTPLFATHFKVGQYVDIRGKTIDRGFQGVMKRWGFHGMPASHGVTKTHRRPGNIGSGGNKARVMPGTKMPGHMGNRLRMLRGQRIIRMNTKYNIIWVLGQASAGEVNSVVRMYDTILPLRNWRALNQTPPFPTYFPNAETEELPEELWVDDLFNFNAPTIEYTEE